MSAADSRPAGWGDVFDVDATACGESWCSEAPVALFVGSDDKEQALCLTCLVEASFLTGYRTIVMLHAAGASPGLADSLVSSSAKALARRVVPL